MIHIDILSRFLSCGIPELEYQAVGDLTCASHFTDEDRAYEMTVPNPRLNAFPSIHIIHSSICKMRVMFLIFCTKS